MLFGILWLLFYLCCSGDVYACQVIDDTGQEIRLVHPAQRIISLAPDLTELLFAAGAGSHIVGVIDGADYPPAAKTIPIIGKYNSINIELIVALHPDLIVAWEGGSSLRQLHLLQQLGITLFLSHQHLLTDIPNTLERFGCLAGTATIAHQAAKQFLQRYRAINQYYSHRKRISVFYEVWPQPLMTVNKASWIDQIITLCGGKNIFAELPFIAPEVNIEGVIKANPSIIFGPQETQWKQIWYDWPQLAAVKRRHLVSLNPDWIERAGPRLLNGAEQMCQEIEQARE